MAAAAQQLAGAVGAPTGPGPAGRVLYLVAGTVLSVLFVAPLVWEVLRSFQPESAISATAVGQLHPSDRHQLPAVAAGGRIIRNVGNSLIVAGTAVVTALLATAAGYGFGRFRFRGPGLLRRRPARPHDPVPGRADAAVPRAPLPAPDE